MSIVERDLQRCDPDNVDRFESRVYECRIWLCPEPEGGYSVIAPFLPGVVSQGENVQEAIENVKEAFQGVVAEYLESGGNIPWSSTAMAEKPLDAIEKWILVHV
jgi:predicted RNase H-like HicB family nuclease